MTKIEKFLSDPKLQNKYKWLVAIICLVAGGPLSAVAAFFVWKTPWSQKTKIVVTIILTIVINLLSLWFVALTPKILQWEKEMFTK